MNKKIRNGGLYGLLISLAIGLLLADYKVTTYNQDIKMIEYIPVYEYIVTLLRYGAIGTLLGMFIVWRKNKPKEEGPKTYYMEVFFGVFLLSMGVATLVALFR